MARVVRVARTLLVQVVILSLGGLCQVAVAAGLARPNREKAVLAVGLVERVEVPQVFSMVLVLLI